MADSITTHTLAGSGIEERPGVGVLAPVLRVAPNPISGRGTTISFSTGNSARCRLALHDVGGSLVETLLDREVGPGRHETRWQPDMKLAAGVYLLRLTAGCTAAGCRVILE